MPITRTTVGHGARAFRALGLPIAAVLIAACGDGTTGTPQESATHDGGSAVAADARHIEVAARSFSYDEDEITVEAGEDIAIVLMSEDSLHDFTVDDFDAHVAADRDEPGFGGFRAGEPGRYTFYCSVEGHREAGMQGVLVVEA